MEYYIFNRGTEAMCAPDCRGPYVVFFYEERDGYEEGDGEGLRKFRPARIAGWRYRHKWNVRVPGWQSWIPYPPLELDPPEYNRTRRLTPSEVEMIRLECELAGLEFPE